MQEPIPFARPAIGEEEIAAVTAVLRSGWLTTGAEALAFEEEFRQFVRCSHALAVSSATAGLHLAMEATGVRPGTTVVVPSLTFTATAEVAHYLGARVQFADVQRDSLLLDPESADRQCAAAAHAGTPVRAIVPVHLAGAVCPMEELNAVARRWGAVVIEDAAHAFPSATPQGYAGTLGTVGVYSFYANKTITTGEGGMVVTNNEEVAHRMRTMRLHGIDRESWDRYRGTRPSWYYQVVAAGYKYNMTDIAAAMGRVQLRRADALHGQRCSLARGYRAGLLPLESRGTVTVPQDSPGHAWHLFILRLGNHHSRDQFINDLSELRIGTSVHYIPLHQMPWWRQTTATHDSDLPVTSEVAPRLVSLPLFPDLTTAAQERVVEAVHHVLEKAADRGN